MASGGGSAVFEAVVLLSVVVFIVIAATVILAQVRRRMRTSKSRRGRIGFDLAQLRRLKDCGQLSAKEYDNLVQAMNADGK